MKKLLHSPLAAAAFAFVACLATAADDEKEMAAPKGTIHPKGDLKPAELVVLAKVAPKKYIA